MSARRYEIGLGLGDLPSAEAFADGAARSSPSTFHCVSRARWPLLGRCRHVQHRQALEVANHLCRMGSNPRQLMKGQERFGGTRKEWRLH